MITKLILASLALATTLSAKEKPNIVFILADDMGYDSISVNNPAMGPLKTPHIDKLAAQGMNFTDAHSGSAVCTPTRYSLLTGRYCWRSRLKRSVLWDYARPLIEDDRITVAEMLKKEGYSTAMVGKWHLGLNWYDSDGKLANADLKDSDNMFSRNEGTKRVKEAQAKIDFSKTTTGGPNSHGFDYWFGVDLPNMAPYLFMENGKTVGIPSVMKPKSMFGHDGLMLPGWKLENILPTLGEKSVEWITSAAKNDKPFFLYVPMTSPHTPISPSKEWQGKSGIDAYCDFVMETDAVVGQIMKALDDAGVADKTLVIFSTDNGTAPAGAKFKLLEKHGVDLRKHLKGHKAQIADGGHRVPMIVRWPGKVEPGSTCADVVGLTDFMATTAEILDIKLPENTAEDSFSILPLITGKAKTLPNRPLVVNHDIGGNFAIRKGKWKLIPGKKGVQLYDMEADLKESKNIAQEHPEVVEMLQTTLDRYKKSGRSR
ncbi:arylsulfatase [Oceaniferula spumae]|uniref:Arylsulfatase n=1 Tax=Oceaniferula spumae TaxID=2979115 RepID=A0AAT9FMP6_9BACT